MHSLECREMGTDCDKVIVGSSGAEVKEKALRHVQEVHAEMFAGISSPEEMAEMEKVLESKIK